MKINKRDSAKDNGPTKRKASQRSLGLLAILLIVLAIFLFAVSGSTNIYGFAKQPVSRILQLRKIPVVIKRPTSKPTPKPTLKPKPTPTPIQSQHTGECCSDADCNPTIANPTRFTSFCRNAWMCRAGGNQGGTCVRR